MRLSNSCTKGPLLVNHWLVNDLELDITKREQAEKALSLSEEKYSKAFQSSPNAVLISKIKDGKLLEVNDSFCKLFEFSREEALNNSALSLGFWVDQQDREKVVTEMLQEKGPAILAEVIEDAWNHAIEKGRVPFRV